MFWGCISYFGVVDGNINSEKYISILDDNVWPVVARYFANNPWMFPGGLLHGKPKTEF